MKKLFALLLALIMVFSMVACGAKEAPPAETPAEKPAEEPAEAPAEQENVAIEVWVAQVDWADAWDVMEAKFEEEHPWIEVEHVGLGEENFMTTRLAANDLPAVVQMNNNEMVFLSLPN